MDKQPRMTSIDQLQSEKSRDSVDFTKTESKSKKESKKESKMDVDSNIKIDSKTSSESTTASKMDADSNIKIDSKTSSESTTASKMDADSNIKIDSKTSSESTTASKMDVDLKIEFDTKPSSDLKILPESKHSNKLKTLGTINKDEMSAKSSATKIIDFDHCYEQMPFKPQSPFDNEMTADHGMHNKSCDEFPARDQQLSRHFSKDDLQELSKDIDEDSVRVVESKQEFKYEGEENRGEVKKDKIANEMDKGGKEILQCATSRTVEEEMVEIIDLVNKERHALADITSTPTSSIATSTHPITTLSQTTAITSSTNTSTPTSTALQSSPMFTSPISVCQTSMHITSLVACDRMITSHFTGIPPALLTSRSDSADTHQSTDARVTTATLDVNPAKASEVESLRANATVAVATSREKSLTATDVLTRSKSDMLKKEVSVEPMERNTKDHNGLWFF